MVMRRRGRPLTPGSGRPQVSLTAPPPIHPPYRRPEQLLEPVHRARITRQGTAGREGGSPMTHPSASALTSLRTGSI